MKMPPLKDYTFKEKTKTLFLFKTVMDYGDPRYTVRPCKRTYEDIVSTEDVVSLGPVCYDFNESKEYKGITEAEVLLLAALEGVQLDFEVVDTHDGKYLMLKDLRTDEVLFDRAKYMAEKAERAQ